MPTLGRDLSTRIVLHCLLLTLVCPAVFACTAGQALATTTVAASLNSSQFSVDDTGILTLTVNGSSSADVHIPDVAGLHISKRGQSTRVQVNNGSVSSSIAYTYAIQADKPGKYTIPSVTVTAGGATLSTGDLSIQVTATGGNSTNVGGNAPATRLGSGAANQIAFLQVTLDKKTSWVGEVIPVQIKAYFRRNIKVNLESLPTLTADGLVMPQLEQKPPQTEEEVGDTEYTVLTWNTTVSSVKEGTHTLALDLDATLLLPQRNNPFPGFGGHDFFQDDFFQDFFGSYRSKNVKITSDPVTIDSSPLPTANQPPDFSGAIGHFQLAVTATPTKVGVGDPINLTMTVSGEGNFDRVETPKLPIDPKWKSYPPSSEFTKTGDQTHGSKKFEQALVVRSDSVTAVPPVSFTYFDPSARKYITLNSPPLPLTVSKSAPLTTPPATTAAEATTASAKTAPVSEPGHPGIPGLAPIQTDPGGLREKIVPLFARTWFIALLVLCMVLLSGMLFWTLRLRHWERNPQLQKIKEMSGLLDKALNRVEAAAEAGDSRLFLAACRQAIQEILGGQWQIAPSAITLSDLQARLDPSSQLLAVFAAAEQGAYASLVLSAERMQDYVNILKKELPQLT